MIFNVNKVRFREKRYIYRLICTVFNSYMLIHYVQSYVATLSNVNLSVAVGVILSMYSFRN